MCANNVEYMDVSYDCELNLSTNHESTFFKEATSQDEWKEAMWKEYDALIKKWDIEFSGPSIWNETNWLQVGI